MPLASLGIASGRASNTAGRANFDPTHGAVPKYADQDKVIPSSVKVA